MAITTTKARLNLSIDSELKQEVGEVLNEIGLDYTTAINLYFNKIRRDRKIPFELEARKNLTVDEFLGSNWRRGWLGLSYKVELIPEAQDDFYKLDNSQRLHVKKSLIKLENQGMLAGEALHGNLAGYRKLKHKKLGLRIVFHETVNAIEIIEVIAIGKRSDNEIYTISEKRIRNR